MTPDGVSPLLQALYEGRREDALMLRDSGGPLDVFEAAALAETRRVAELLGADPSLAEARSPDGFTALHLAAFLGDEETVGELLQRGADAEAIAHNPMEVRPLHSAAAARALPSVVVLLDHGADPDARQQRGITALHAAALHGDSEMVAALMDAGANPLLADEDGSMPAAYARRGGHDDLARELGG